VKPPYYKVVEELRERGRPVETRFGPAREVLGGRVEFAAGEMVSRRGVNDALGFMELMQILAGVFDPEEIRRVAPRADHSLFTAQMAYGPRIAGQVPRLIEALEKDPLTRQAVLFIGHPDDGPTPDLPCTLTMQFVARDGTLDAVTSMRSWDATRGLTYDVVFQGGLVMALARCLGLLPGRVVCTAGSLHLYDSEAGKTPVERDRRFVFDDVRVPRRWDDIQRWAKKEVVVMDRVPFGVWVVE